MPCNHKWEDKYKYASLSMDDQSGTVTIGQKCEVCNKTRSKYTTYVKDGSIENVSYREHE